MPKVVVASSLRRFVACPPELVAGATVGEALSAYFALHPGVRGYVLDDQRGVRHHVAVFVDGTPVADRVGLTDPSGPDAVIDIIQALSGGA